MTERRMNSVDMSKWGGPLTLQQALDMWAMGITNIKVGDGFAGVGGAGQYARQQADNWLCVSKDATLDAYIYLYMGGDPRVQVRQAIQTLQGYPVRRWWLDAEDQESPELDYWQRIHFLQDCLAELGDRPAGIYTGRWWWVPMMANATAFAHLPLWNSWYDNDPDEDGLPYGGWEHAAVEQYGDTQLIAGHSVDVNYDSTLDEEEGLSVEDKARLDRLERIVAGYGMDDDDGKRLTGEEAVAYIDEHERSLYLGLANTQSDVALLKEKVGS